LLGLSLLGLALAVTSWIVEGVTPSWVVFPIVLAVGLIRARRGGTSGIVLLGLAALVLLLVHIPFVSRRGLDAGTRTRLPRARMPLPFSGGRATRQRRHPRPDSD
jgi:hypothetical protein